MTTTCFTRPAFAARVVPVIVLTDPAHAVPLAHALLEGGIDVMEITLRSDAALASIEAVAKAVPQMHLGAGTVTRVAEVQHVIDAGATFALSPGCTDALFEAVKTANLPFIPGVMTPGEVMHRREQGFSLMKLFPAQQAGGLGMLKALGAPIPDVAFCPTGGVSPENLKDFLNLPNVAMAGGSWLTPAQALAAGDWKKITQLAREATAIANG
ncbi:MAG: bifunctional 4-hydroxy-2-oxoglutarate aldolase/2-dehydro-3-deoxy-phosphogluconate aldolase [Hydrogenophaga sp.]|jgi:2-dehydro-3-deoxyphosphogluconate aldolase/(4S)-4-hydroxy-2-oxoglutarate aldolase|uniref:bifunctional 4-hydroxy-2-oxoglutarate aldolase/2-dehydro-3-deoxy-phosphogluconate aldolase n=1 Tax=Hydrogenophaga sp. TaxID=1904254 RepID=UPI00271B3FAA|nr:bifunctional 4-hydroxy-2-oxoglutarate aldolase/2-dehydro-3-deoxy-phosphogluconate aldolase [Hydrogenophaga sp.]MDO9570742.1 bifunctional 4-hydroxy-2-oxoglutarate aldolase/2-dehydro-3-deoxy-phosphogluconate aldolase [Hydrogenophaga sp.]MDP2096810.1 bifunctional 4-hydroxy-2-oxoglutarate aldolase/2-dehydro-3-deoxy-phosphogluconate aldolase [Hydrogenophaga sp.]